MCEVIDQWLSDDPDGSLEDIAGVASLHEGRQVEGPHRSIERHPDVFGRPARGSGRHRHVPRAVGNASPPVLAQHVVDAGLSLSLQLVRQAHLGQRYSMRSASDTAAELIDLDECMHPITCGSPTTSSACEATG